MGMAVNLFEPGNMFFRWSAALYYLHRFVAVWAFTLVDLVEYQAALTSHRLTITVLSTLVLDERVEWRRWAAIVVRLCGVIIAIQPGTGFLDLHTILPIVSTLCFAVYGVLTGYAELRELYQYQLLLTGSAAIFF